MSPEFRGGPVHVRAPATSANLGPGFDALGLALQWHDDVVARAGDHGLTVAIAGEGEGLARDETHLVVRAMRATFDHLGGQPRGLDLSCVNRIPHGRGLGSSAAAIVAGVRLARALVLGGDEALHDPGAFALAAELEGHPDNVAACFYGGITLAWVTDAVAHAVRATVDPAIRPIALVPPFESSTERARGLLPSVVPHADAVFGVARSTLLMALLARTVVSGPGALLEATEDRLHQQYRAQAMPETAGLVRSLRARGLAAVVSGAGPTVLVLAQDDVEVQKARAMVPIGWTCVQLPVDDMGSHVVNPPRREACETPEFHSAG